MSATSSRRCRRPETSASASAIAASSTPAARAAAVAAAAFSRLCGPGTGLGRKLVVGANSTRPPRRERAEATRDDSDVGFASGSRRCAAWLRGRRRTCRGGRGDRARGSAGRRRAGEARGCPRAGSSTARRRSRRLGRAHRRAVNERPTLPATATGDGGTEHRAEQLVVVVLPFVPVTPINGFRRGESRARPRSRSGSRIRAAAARGGLPGTPGLLISSSTPSSKPSSSFPGWTSTPASASLPVSTSAARSAATVGTPRRASASAADWPERASPSTSARRGSFTAFARRARDRRRRRRRPRRQIRLL